MATFTSRRERRLWLWAGAVLAFMYLTLGMANMLASALRDRGLASGAIWVGLWLIAGAIFFNGLKKRPSGLEIGLMLGIAGAYLIAMMRITLPEERSHLIEYSVVALLVYEALKERASNVAGIRWPGPLAFGITVLAGTLDEGIQWILPNRTFDWIDIGFDAVAAFLAIAGSGSLTWARGKWDVRNRRPGKSPSE